MFSQTINSVLLLTKFWTQQNYLRERVVYLTNHLWLFYLFTSNFSFINIHRLFIKNICDSLGNSQFHNRSSMTRLQKKTHKSNWMSYGKPKSSQWEKQNNLKNRTQKFAQRLRKLATVPEKAQESFSCNELGVHGICCCFITLNQIKIHFQHVASPFRQRHSRTKLYCELCTLTPESIP